ncbi:MAG: hypothetical protein JWM31_807, partial [Solirubrobacterales bacterium]|nr:hypothetical protein [Solirubrobacterales bacterium]
RPPLTRAQVTARLLADFAAAPTRVALPLPTPVAG